MKCLRLSFLALLVSLAPSAGAALPRVVVYPFEVYNAADVAALAPGLQSMLASRISGTGYSVETASTKDAREAEWGLRTTITQIGGVYSIDASLRSSGPRADGTRTYETAKSPDAILSALETVAARLKEVLEREARSAPEAVREPAPPPSAPPAAPAPAPSAQPAPAAAPPPAPAPRAAPEPKGLSEGLRTQRLGAPVPGQARGIAVADADRDGTAEILVLTEEAVVAFRDGGGEIVRAWEIAAPRGFTPLSLSAGDVDGNGIPEVFVAGMSSAGPISQALEWFGSALAPKGERIHAFVRVVSAPGTRPRLLGAVGGLQRDVFLKGARSFEWTGRSYEDRGGAATPREAHVVNFDLLELEPGRAPFAVVTAQSGKVLVYDEEGKELFDSGDRIQGSANLIIGAESFPGWQDEDIVRLHSRVVSWRGSGGTTYVFVPKNHASMGSFFRRSPSYSNSQILAFRWADQNLIPEAETPKLSGFIADIDLGTTPGSGTGATLYGAVVQGEGFLARKIRSVVIAYDLSHEPKHR